MEYKKFNRTPSNQSYGGMIIYIKHGINYGHIEGTNATDRSGTEAFELQRIKIYNNVQPIYIYNVYSRSHNRPALENQVNTKEQTITLDTALDTLTAMPTTSIGDHTTPKQKFGFMALDRKSRTYYAQ